MNTDPMIEKPPAAPVRALDMGQSLFQGGQSGPVWRVRTGVLRLERQGYDGRSFVQLALPGDWVGVEALCAEPYALTATALVDSRVECVTLPTEAERHQAMMAALLQQQQRAADAMRLRSGTVAHRVQCFVAALSRARGTITQRLRDVDLPTLRDIASVVDSAPESVCRALGGLVEPTRSRGGRGRTVALV